MYNTDFICTYKLLHEDEQEELYRIQYLQAFNLTQWNDKQISLSVTELYNTLKDNLDIKEILKRLASSSHLQSYITLIGDKEEDIFCLLFNFDFFDLFHRCLCDAINKKDINIKNKQNLLEKL